jgi:hypothetical protein
MKICTICKDEKETSEFSKNAKRYDGLQSECKTCASKKAKEYYARNKERMVKQINDSRIQRLAEYRQRFYDILKVSSCVDCGNNNPIVLDFDHKVHDEKTHEVSKMLHDGYSWERILEEISKCDVRCANCHRIKTAKEQNWYKNLK